MEGPGVDGPETPAQLPSGARVDLRGPPGVVDAGAGGGEPLAALPGAGSAAGRLRAAPGVHPCRVPAADGAPVLRLLGLSDDRLLCPDQPLRHAAGPDGPDRLPAPAGDRRAPWLGTIPLPRR